MTAAPSAQSSPCALTMGDPAGIGPEITLRAWADLAARTDASPFFVIGGLSVFEHAARKAGIRAPAAIDHPAEASDVFARALPVIPIACPNILPGNPDAAAAPAIIKSIEMATAFAKSGTVSAIVTNPIAKHILYDAGFSHPGHTEFLASLAGGDPVMMLSAGDDLRCALITIHMPLAQVPQSINQEAIVETARTVSTALIQEFGIAAPRLALAGLNPHAGEGGALGNEETIILNPAAATLRRGGVKITDAQSADTLFHADARAGYDAVICMYHDQGLIPVKSLDFYGGVNHTLGLPIIRTSPDHGTAFAIAGNGTARADSLVNAVMAAQNRAAYKAAHNG